jgi:hypothetical protein
MQFEFEWLEVTTINQGGIWATARSFGCVGSESPQTSAGDSGVTPSHCSTALTRCIPPAGAGQCLMEKQLFVHLQGTAFSLVPICRVCIKAMGMTSSLCSALWQSHWEALLGSPQWYLMTVFAPTAHRGNSPSSTPAQVAPSAWPPLLSAMALSY